MILTLKEEQALLSIEEDILRYYDNMFQRLAHLEIVSKSYGVRICAKLDQDGDIVYRARIGKEYIERLSVSELLKALKERGFIEGVF